MVRCSVPGCWHNYHLNRKEISFFRVPKILKHRRAPETTELSTRRQKLWLERISLSDITARSRVCSRHFVRGKPADLYQEDDIDWAPSLFLKKEESEHEIKRAQLLRDSREVSNQPAVVYVPINVMVSSLNQKSEDHGRGSSQPVVMHGLSVPSNVEEHKYSSSPTSKNLLKRKINQKNSDVQIKNTGAIPGLYQVKTVTSNGIPRLKNVKTVTSNVIPGLQNVNAVTSNVKPGLQNVRTVTSIVIPGLQNVNTGSSSVPYRLQYLKDGLKHGPIEINKSNTGKVNNDTLYAKCELQESKIKLHKLQESDYKDNAQLQDTQLELESQDSETYQEVKHGSASTLPLPEECTKTSSKSKECSNIRSRHNEQEKDRRAELRHSLEKLNALIHHGVYSPYHSTLDILTKAKSFIRNLEEKECEAIQLREQLEQEKKRLQNRLLSLQRIYSHSLHRGRQERSLSECSASSSISTLSATSQVDMEESDLPMCSHCNGTGRSSRPPLVSIQVQTMESRLETPRVTSKSHQLNNNPLKHSNISRNSENIKNNKDESDFRINKSSLKLNNETPSLKEIDEENSEGILLEKPEEILIENPSEIQVENSTENKVEKPSLKSSSSEKLTNHLTYTFWRTARGNVVDRWYSKVLMRHHFKCPLCKEILATSKYFCGKLPKVLRHLSKHLYYDIKEDTIRLNQTVVEKLSDNEEICQRINDKNLSNISSDFLPSMETAIATVSSLAREVQGEVPLIQDGCFYTDLVHPSDFVWTCNICNIKFIDCEDINAHTQAVHPNIINEFALKAKVVKKMKKPLEKKTLICKICGNIYASPAKLRYHLNLHKNKEAYQCNICKKNLSSPRSLKFHKRIHIHGSSDYRSMYPNHKGCVCHVCGKYYVFANVLKRHISVAHGAGTANSANSFLCSKCPKTFDSQGGLRCHESRIHQPSLGINDHNGMKRWRLKRRNMLGDKGNNKEL